jgi:hypothetical protein
MQYILTEEEYQKLKEVKSAKELVEKKKLQDFCTMVCNTLPILFWNNKEPRIWGCGLTSDHEHYCDCCPSQEICPSEYKHWSK